MGKNSALLLCICLIFSIIPFFFNSQVIDAGNGHSIILDRNNFVWTIGRNDFGQLGDSSLINSTIPKKIKYLKNIIAISRGYDHSLAVDKKGNLYAWGRNNYGQLGIGLPIDKYIPFRVKKISNVIAIEGGHWHTIALKSDGSVWSWGHNLYAELGNGNRDHSDVPSVVLERNKGIIKPINEIVQIASVGYHSLALKKDGSVFSWGSNTFKELGRDSDEEFQTYAELVPNLPKIIQISVGWHHSLALDENGDIWQWGSIPSTQNNDITGEYYEKPHKLLNLPKFTKIACGSWHNLAIDEDKKLWSWGKNNFGMLGSNDSISTRFPKKNSYINHCTDIGAGCFQSIVLLENGDIYTFGDNNFGQLGVNNYLRAYKPQKMLLNIKGRMNFQSKNEAYLLKKILRDNMGYFLLFFSVILNVFLFYRLKSKKNWNFYSND